MKTIKIKDNSDLEKSLLNDVGAIIDCVCDKTLEQLQKDGVFIFPEILKDAEDITKEQMVIQTVNEKYHTGNVMGFLGYGDERLIIASRFSKNADNEKDYFFQYLLENVLELPNLVNLQTEFDQSAKTLDLLMFLFPYYLKNAVRKGIFKTYVQNAYNDANVKGTIDVARHISQNTPFVGKIAYDQREFSFDNSLMQLVRHTIEYVRRKPYGSKLLFSAKDEARLVVDATPKYRLCDRNKIISENEKNTVRHAYYSEYRELQRLCLMILKHQKHHIGLGTRHVYGILFDGAWLWEEYINKIIGKDFYHPMNKGRKGAQQLFSTDTGKAARIYPDFISKASDPRVIADAKYKPHNNIGNRDYLQVLAYMFRFEAKIGLYLYPDSVDNKASVLKLNRGISYEIVQARNDICVKKIGLVIPSEAMNYNEFSNSMVESEKRFSESIKQ